MRERRCIIIRISATIQKDGSIDRVMPENIANEIYHYGSKEMSQVESYEILNNIIIPMKNKVHTYCAEFDAVFSRWAEKNSTLAKMAEAIQKPDRGLASKKLGLKQRDLNGSQEVDDMIVTMKKGHSLLLELRKTLTGQDINTKFIISFEDRVYEIEENEIELEYVLSRFGAGTISNPVSLAYNMTVELMQKLIEEKKVKEITKTDIWTTIQDLKRPYLDQKSAEWAARGETREYKTIFFDSKDAEIYELYSQQREQGIYNTLELSDYTRLRKSMGGGGGYASPFYKIGDIGRTQIKYFNLSKNAKETAVNFARFSLLRDRLRELERYLSGSDIQSITHNLIKFFSESEDHISGEIDHIFNQQAKEAIMTSLGWK